MKLERTLWDLIEPVIQALRPRGARAVQARPDARVAPPAMRPSTSGRQRARAGKVGASADSMQARYDAVAQAMLERYQVRVRKWRTGMSGIAWYVTYKDGRRQRLIEAPRPKGPMSAAVFLHEIGHHAIGFDVYKPRCLEEYHAWRWAIEAMESNGLNITDAVRHRMHMSLWYAVSKAKRRGIKVIPGELGPYLERPARRRRTPCQAPGR